MSFSHLVRAYGESQCIPKGRTVHGMMITSGFNPNIYTNNQMIFMYSVFHQMQDAQKLFDRMPHRNIISWTNLISGYFNARMAYESLASFRSMCALNYDTNHYTFVAALSACATLSNARTGKELHAKIYRINQEFNPRVSNCLVNMYGKCGKLGLARRVFYMNSASSSVSLTSLLTDYCKSGEPVEALKIFVHSHKAGVGIDEFVCAGLLSACAASHDLKAGMQVHSLVVKCGIGVEQFIMTGLISLYAKCGELNMARRVFLDVNKPDLSAYTTLISACVTFGKGREAIYFFRRLLSAGLKPNERTFSSVLGAFAEPMIVEAGEQLHCLIIKYGLDSVTIVGNAVLAFYAKCGLKEESLKAFDDMDKRDIVSWNALISGHVKSGCYIQAIELIKSMLAQGFDPSLYTYSSILNLCGDVPSIAWGKQTHCRILKLGFDSNVVVGTTLVEMYGKCGRIHEARKCFDNLPSKNLVSWNTMLVSYAQHGLGREALDFFALMKQEGIRPDQIAFVGVLSACVHAGLVQEGLHHFNSMTNEYCLGPEKEHIACMVSLYAQKGETKRAYEFITSSSNDIKRDKVVWRCLLSGCKTHKDFTLGIYAAKNILSIDPNDSSAHIMLSNIYGEAKMWDELAQVRCVLEEKTLKKDAGYSWIELKNMIYSFTADHSQHFDENNNHHQIMIGLTTQLVDADADAGYQPDFLD